MKSTLTHIALHVKDVDACIDFYKRYCNMSICHERHAHGHPVVWLAEPGKERQLILVLIPEGEATPHRQEDFSHLGFAVLNREAVDTLAALALKEGCLRWHAREAQYPVGYYCGVTDPNGNVVEFSYGQPLGPGALIPDWGL
ncbi:MAG: VOC family protein [Spongiibacteraceae bacterium]|nr:VOC family protein [Spongiibacteraceae bacterium]